MLSASGDWPGFALNGPDILSGFVLSILEYCTKSGKLILTKIVATRCQILRLKCTKFDFGWGSAP